MLYIHPDECIDCGACEPECPVTAIFPEEEVPGEHDVVHCQESGRVHGRQSAGRPTANAERHLVPGSSGHRPREDSVCRSHDPESSQPQDRKGRPWGSGNGGTA